MSKFDFCSKITERDMDFLIMLLCEESQEFLDTFLEPKGIEGAALCKVYHSLTHPSYGESDITLLVEKDGKKYAVLIEDKIDAIAMPEQSARYAKRAKEAVKKGEYEDYILFITAPANYLNTNEEAKKYPNHYAYEDILTFVKEHSFPCSDFAIGLLEAALYREKNGYQVQEVPDITSFWRNMAVYMSAHEDGVEFFNPQNAENARGARANWFRFKCDLKGAALYYKTKGFVDLQLNGQANNATEIKQKLYSEIMSDMKWIVTGKSLSLRIEVPAVDVKKPFAEIENNLPEVFRAVRSLQCLASDFNNSGILGEFLKK